MGAGSFNPAIIHPLWLAEKGLIPQNLAQHAASEASGRPLVVTPRLASFLADWLSVQVTQQQLVLATVEQGREVDLRDVALGLFQLLPETPLGAIGINADSHFRTEGASAWHAFGDKFVPKNYWEPLFAEDGWKSRGDGKRVGMRSLVVEVHREDTPAKGHVRIELAPSVRVVPNGVYLGINAHFDLGSGETRGSGRDAATVLETQWKSARELETRLISTIMNTE